MNAINWRVACYTGGLHLHVCRQSAVQGTLCNTCVTSTLDNSTTSCIALAPPALLQHWQCGSCSVKAWCLMLIAGAQEVVASASWVVLQPALDCSPCFWTDAACCAHTVVACFHLKVVLHRGDNSSSGGSSSSSMAMLMAQQQESDQSVKHGGA